MRNTLTIQSSDTCKCICLDSVHDETNSIYLSLDVKNVTNPKLQIYKDGTLVSTVTLISNQENLVIIPTDLYGANAVITFKYLDDDYTGNTFTINFPATLEGNLLVKKVSEYIFDAQYTKTGGGSGQTITVDDQLSISSKNPVENCVITAKLNDLDGEMQEVFQSVSNGKALIASAVTDKGVPTASDATFSTMADNIESIPTGGITGEVASLITDFVVYFDQVSVVSISK